MENSVAVIEEVKVKRNMARFIQKGGTERSYEEWATQVGQRMHINKLDQIVCSKLGIYTVAHLAYKTTELPEGMHIEEFDEYLIENSENPYEISRLYLAARSNADAYLSKESILNEHLTQFPKTDYERFGDKNNLDSVSRSWFKKDGYGLDGKIEEINSMGLHTEEITIQDAIEFVTKYRPGQYKNPFQITVEKIAARFKVVTSFQIKGYYLQHIMKMNQPSFVISDEELPF